jgi:hypothetical protein
LQSEDVILYKLGLDSHGPPNENMTLVIFGGHPSPHPAYCTAFVASP